MRIDTIIFDVDGTLWDSTEAVARAWNDAIADAGIEREKLTGEILKKEFGKPMNLIADSLFPDLGEEERMNLLEICCREQHKQLEESNENLLYPGVQETFAALAKKCRICVVSNCQKGYIELCLRKNQLEQYVLDTECYGNTGKSKGENIKAVIERNQLENCIYVGDTQGDFRAAKEAGIPFAFAEYGFGDVEDADWNIKEIGELLEIVQGER